MQARQYPYSKFILTSPDYHHAFRSVDRPGWTTNRAGYLANLERYFARRPGDFRVIDIPAGEGWEKLCAFLGVPVPDRPFPFRNRLAPAAEPSAAGG